MKIKLLLTILLLCSVALGQSSDMSTGMALGKDNFFWYNPSGQQPAHYYGEMTNITFNPPLPRACYSMTGEGTMPPIGGVRCDYVWQVYMEPSPAQGCEVSSNKGQYDLHCWYDLIAPEVPERTATIPYVTEPEWSLVTVEQGALLLSGVPLCGNFQQRGLSRRFPPHRRSDGLPLSPQPERKD